MSLIQRILRPPPDVAGTGTGIPGVGVPWKTSDPSGKPLLETGGFQEGFLELFQRAGGRAAPARAAVAAGRGVIAARPVAGMARNVATRLRGRARRTRGGGAFEAEEFQVPFKSTPYSSLLPPTSALPAVGSPWKTQDPYGKPQLESEEFQTRNFPVREPPYHARFGAGEEFQFQVERKDVDPTKAARYESFQDLAAKPVETQLIGTSMPIREGKLRRNIRDRVNPQSRIAKLRDSDRIQMLKQAQFRLDKFTKEQSFYVDRSIYPFLTCQNCIWFLAPSTQDDNVPRCAVVSEKGGSGIINPEGTSTAFNASPARLKLIERAYGRGEGKRGVLPQTVRSRIMPIGKKLIYPDIPTETA